MHRLNFLRNKYVLIQIAVFVIVYILVIGLVPFGETPRWWRSWGSLIIPLTTLSTALLIGFFGLFFEREDNLEKRLNVSFKYKKDGENEWITCMQCKNVYLASESDIRAWGQQLGQQMNNNQRLNFYPSMDGDLPERKKSKSGESYKLYNLKIYLREEEKFIKENKDDLAKDYILTWEQKENKKDFKRFWRDAEGNEKEYVKKILNVPKPQNITLELIDKIDELSKKIDSIV